MPYGTGGGGGGGGGGTSGEIAGTVAQGFPIGSPDDIPNPVIAGIVAGGAVQAWDGVVVIEAVGDMADSAATNGTGSWSLVALLKGLISRLPTLGQKVKGGSVSVSLASDHDAVATTAAQLPSTIGQKAVTSSLSVTLSSDHGNVPIYGSVVAELLGGDELTSYGGTTTANDNVQVVPYNIARRVFMFQNLSDTDMYIKLGATASAGGGSFRMPANQAEPFIVQNAAQTYPVYVFCTAGGKAYSAWTNLNPANEG